MILRMLAHKALMGLLSEKLSYSDQSNLFLGAGQIIIKKLRPLREVAKSSKVWTQYKKFKFSILSTTTKKRDTRPLLILFLNLTGWQMHFTIVLHGEHTHKTFSLGTILRLYKVQVKRARRETRRGIVALRFFKIFFKTMFKKSQGRLVLVGYKRRYDFFIQKSVLPFSKIFAFDVSILTKTLSGAFCFRRIKGVKKRIRKRLARELK